MTDRFWAHFFEIYEAIPRQGPGERESTEQALRLLPALRADQRILDIGCGAGVQTIDLARACEAEIVAVDNHPAFLSKLEKSLKAEGLERRVKVQVADMNALPFPDGAFDVIWSEGSIFIMGFEKGLEGWRRLLVPGGHMVVSDFCWFREDPPAELRELFRDGNPDVGGVMARRKIIAASGYRLLHEFLLPDAGWLENYHGPLGRVLEQFRAKHAGDPEALEVADGCQREIDLYRKYPGVFGYVFFVMRRE